MASSIDRLRKTRDAAADDATSPPIVVDRQSHAGDAAKGDFFGADLPGGIALQSITRMASSIERLRKTRGVVRSSVTRVLTQLNDLLQQPSPDEATLSSHVDYIIQREPELTPLNQKIADATDDDRVEQELEGAAESTLKISYAVSQARFFLRNAQ